MFGRKAKELQELLGQRNHENELMRSRIAELEAEVAKLHEQEGSVLKAITEAGKTADRIVSEANTEADNIRAEANSEHARLIAEAKQRVCDAATQANGILAQADQEARSIKESANVYSSSTRAEADKYSDNIRLDANIFVERSIMAAQQEVKKRKDVLAELNSLLKSTADYVSDQVLTFTDAIETSAKQADETTAELCRDIEKCSCSCKDCAEPCVNVTEKDIAEAKAEMAPAAEEAREAEAPVHTEAAPAAESESEPEPPVSAAEPEPAIKPEELPEEYSSPAELMHSIYNIEGRILPGEEALDDLTGTPFNAGEPLPVDSELNKIVSDVLKN